MINVKGLIFVLCGSIIYNVFNSDNKPSGEGYSPKSLLTERIELYLEKKNKRNNFCISVLKKNFILKNNRSKSIH